MLSAFDKLICAKCNGKGYNNYYDDNGTWSEWCRTCNGKGTLGELIVDDIVVDDEMVYITKKEYEELLEYKDMYERLCT